MREESAEELEKEDGSCEVKDLMETKEQGHMERLSWSSRRGWCVVGQHRLAAEEWGQQKCLMQWEKESLGNLGLGFVDERLDG
jgi:hypothetical protein